MPSIRMTIQEFLAITKQKARLNDLIHEEAEKHKHMLKIAIQEPNTQAKIT